jgi:hypothetical protein
MTVLRRAADITYKLPIFDLIRNPDVENVSPRLSSEDIPLQTFFKFYNTLVPKRSDGVDPSAHRDANVSVILPESDQQRIFNLSMSTDTQIKEAIIEYLVYWNKFPRTNLRALLARHTTYKIPWLMQEQSSFGKGTGIVTATVCDTVYRIRLAGHSFYIFTAFTLFTLAWCWCRLLPIVWSRSPALSTFTELDVAKLLMDIGGQEDSWTNLCSWLTRLNEKIEMMEDWRLYLKDEGSRGLPLKEGKESIQLQQQMPLQIEEGISMIC